MVPASISEIGRGSMQAEVSGRAKSAYSTWKKMKQKLGLDM
jgi:(p)ppGpp synthase/HD superfamily hydrolase